MASRFLFQRVYRRKSLKLGTEVDLFVRPDEVMIIREGSSHDPDLMIKMEVGVMNILLKNAGFQVDIATTSG
jgi:hypothetical protein